MGNSNRSCPFSKLLCIRKEEENVIINICYMHDWIYMEVIYIWSEGLLGNF